jgi:cytochrome c5
LTQPCNCAGVIVRTAAIRYNRAARSFRTSVLRDPEQHFFPSFMPVLGILIGMAVGQVALADSEELAAIPAAPISTAEAVDAPRSGREVYNEICIACHAAPGVGGAPALGDSDAWAARIAQGMDTLIDRALHGFSGSAGIMPRKGGRVDLSDEEIIKAVEYMVEQGAQ